MRIGLVISVYVFCLLSFVPILQASDGSHGANCVGEGMVPDICGVCGGENSALDDCGVCFGNNEDKDDCGICFGNNENKDDCGVCFGNNENKDDCGVCFGKNLTMDCNGDCYGPDVVECGTCVTPGERCDELCRDITPPEYYKEGLLAGCLPRSCRVINVSTTGHWALVADSCPDLYGIAQDTYQFSDGMHCGCIRKPEVGCYTPDTVIMTPEGEQRIDQLKAGERVLNPINGNHYTIKKIIQSPEKDALVEFGYDITRIKVTQNHPVYTHRGLKRAIDLVKGDIIYGSDGKSHAITVHRLLETRYGQQVFNLILDTTLSNMEVEIVKTAQRYEPHSVSITDNLVLSGGIITGDMVLQVLLNQQ